MKLIVIIAMSEGSEIYLIDNLILDEFNFYLTANRKCIGIDSDPVLEELQSQLKEATSITDPSDNRIKNIDGLILINMAL